MKRVNEAMNLSRLTRWSMEEDVVLIDWIGLKNLNILVEYFVFIATLY